MKTPLVVVGCALAALIGCRGSTAPSGTEPSFIAINAATNAAVFPAAVIVCEGIGFGPRRESSQVLVTVAGSLAPAEIDSWTGTEIHARLPEAVESGPVYVVTRSDTLGPVRIFVRAPSGFDPTTRSWAEGARLPRALWGAGATSVRFPSTTDVASLVLLNGGVDAAGRGVDSTYIGTVGGTGAITSWASAPDSVVPVPRYLHAIAGADRTNSRLELEAVAYMIGGADSTGLPLAGVLGISLDAAGGYGLWTSLTPLPGARIGAAAIVAFGNIIVVGGFGEDSVATTSVLTAQVNPEGTINGWFSGPPLPEGLAFSALALHDTTLYVLGGEAGVISVADPANADLRAAVYAIGISRRTGFFVGSAWKAMAPLPTARARHGAFALDSAIVVTGGIYAGMPSAQESEVAFIQSDGGLGAFAATGQDPLAATAPLYGAAGPVLWSKAGITRATMIGGILPDSTVTARVWWH